MTNANPYETFIRQLKAVRHVRKLTQQQLADRIRLSRPQYAAIESGRSTASFRHVHNLAVALGVCWVIGNPAAPPASRMARKAA